MCPLILAPGFLSGSSNSSPSEADAVGVLPASTWPTWEESSQTLSLPSCSLRVLSRGRRVLLCPAGLEWVEGGSVISSQLETGIAEYASFLDPWGSILR